MPLQSLLKPQKCIKANKLDILETIDKTCLEKIGLAYIDCVTAAPHHALNLIRLIKLYRFKTNIQVN